MNCTANTHRSSFARDVLITLPLWWNTHIYMCIFVITYTACIYTCTYTWAHIRYFHINSTYYNISHSFVSGSLRSPGLYIAHQTPLSMEFSTKEYWSELPFPSPGDLLDLTISDNFEQNFSLFFKQNFNHYSICITHHLRLLIISYFSTCNSGSESTLRNDFTFCEKSLC